MSRYIEIEKALNTLVDCVAGIIPIALAKHIIEHNSIAEVQPVVRGEWIGHVGYYECPICHKLAVTEYNYCPFCGARMVNE